MKNLLLLLTAPKAVRTALRGWRYWAVVCAQNSADHIFVDGEAKGLSKVLRDLRAAKSGIAPLEFTDSSDQFR